MASRRPRVDESSVLISENVDARSVVSGNRVEEGSENFAFAETNGTPTRATAGVMAGGAAGVISCTSTGNGGGDVVSGGSGERIVRPPGITTRFSVGAEGRLLIGAGGFEEVG